MRASYKPLSYSTWQSIVEALQSRTAQPVEKGSLLALMRLLFAGWLRDCILGREACRSSGRGVATKPEHKH